MAEDSYEEIDPIIERWVSRHHFTLFTRTEGFDGQFRAVYLSSDSECCKIWVDRRRFMALGFTQPASKLVTMKKCARIGVPRSRNW